MSTDYLTPTQIANIHGVKADTVRLEIRTRTKSGHTFKKESNGRWQIPKEQIPIIVARWKKRKLMNVSMREYIDKIDKNIETLKRRSKQQEQSLKDTHRKLEELVDFKKRVLERLIEN